MSWLSPALLKSTLNSIENVLEKVDSTAASTLKKGENDENGNPIPSEDSTEHTTINKLTRQTPATPPPKQNSTTKLPNDQDIFQFLNTPIQEQRTKRQATRKNSKQISTTDILPVAESTTSQQNSTTVSLVDSVTPTTEPALSVTEEHIVQQISISEQTLVSQEEVLSTQDEVKQPIPKTEMVHHEPIEAATNEADDKYQEALDQNADLLLENKLLRDEIVSLNKEVLSLAARLKQTQQELENIASKNHENHKLLSEKEKIISKMRRTEEELHNTISSKTSQLHAMNVKLEEALQDIKLKDNKIDSFNQRVAKLSDEKNHSVEEYRQNIDVLNSKIQAVEKELQTREQLVIELKQNLQQREGTWQSSFNDLSNAVASNQRAIEEKKC